jgi:nucleotide-binding universal stress UspA family protein
MAPLPDRSELTAKTTVIRNQSMSIKHILVPVDFSESTQPAIDCALELAGKYSARITLCHVLQLMYNAGVPPVFTFEKEVKTVQEEATKQLRQLAGSLAPMAEVDTAMEAGVPWDRIVHFADEHGADLIVMATHGRSGLKHLMLGSVAERVVQHAPCSVLVVRGNPAHEAPKA